MPSTLPDYRASASTRPRWLVADESATVGAFEVERDAVGAGIHILLSRFVDAASCEATPPGSEEDFEATYYDALAALADARHVVCRVSRPRTTSYGFLDALSSCPNSYGYLGSLSSLPDTCSGASWLSVALQRSGEALVPLYGRWTTTPPRTRSETAAGPVRKVVEMSQADATRDQPAAYPQLRRAITEGRITGRGLPAAGVRSLRLVPEPPAQDEGFQVAFGRAGDPPKDFVRRPRRS